MSPPDPGRFKGRRPQPRPQHDPAGDASLRGSCSRCGSRRHTARRCRFGDRVIVLRSRGSGELLTLGTNGSGPIRSFVPECLDPSLIVPGGLPIFICADSARRYLARAPARVCLLEADAAPDLFGDAVIDLDPWSIMCAICAPRDYFNPNAGAHSVDDL